MRASPARTPQKALDNRSAAAYTVACGGERADAQGGSLGAGEARGRAREARGGRELAHAARGGAVSAIPIPGCARRAARGFLSEGAARSGAGGRVHAASAAARHPRGLEPETAVRCGGRGAGGSRARRGGPGTSRGPGGSGGRRGDAHLERADAARASLGGASAGGAPAAVSGDLGPWPAGRGGVGRVGADAGGARGVDRLGPGAAAGAPRSRGEPEPLPDPAGGALPESGLVGARGLCASAGGGFCAALWLRAVASGNVRGRGAAGGDVLPGGELAADRPDEGSRAQRSRP